MQLRTVNPATGEQVATYERHTPGEAARIISLVTNEQHDWGLTDFSHRADLMLKVAENLRQNSEEYARLITLEMGKPIAQSLAEVEKCAGVCDHYAENSGRYLEREYVEAGGAESFVAFSPLGVVLAVMPWNFPFWQVFRFAAPALMAGNGALLKHASNVTGSALAIENIFRESGLPPNLFRTLKIGSDAVGQVIENPLVSAVTLTGSVGAGRAVAAKAGAELKKTVLELGGSDPYVILEDADLDKAVEVCVNSRLINGGQSCIAAKRFIVVRQMLEEFTERFTALMAAKMMGDPMDKKKDIGPMASVALRDELHGQVAASIDKGAKCILGGTVPEKPGAWYPPTVLTGVKPGMPAYDEEIFGPVAAIIGAEDKPGAIRIANDTQFGLGAAVFTRDTEKGTSIAEKELNAGCCFVNDMVRSDPRLPFGGIKQSGYGRELSYFGIREFVNIKAVFSG
ncbi:MAG: NAD-dependent succinate-semialdehyde dehydrogenase [Marinilabiliales bacterium]|nr:MAG: NAD-dependent succinate-semialdehyde dehydrogenase [Marinilabiliales bacterium]